MLEIKNLTKTYHKNRIAVNNINLKVSQGDIYGFIGTNGSGKTSTIKSNGISIKDNSVEFKKISHIYPIIPI
ncbi:MAG: ATP-binding cassette domain-containing protein [Treponema sp.]